MIFSDGPPEGFAGPNNHWHRHNANGGLCLQGGLVIGSETMSPQQCTSMGGRKEALDNLWMAHLWVVSSWDSAWGLFSPENPQLGGRIGGTAASS